MDIKTDKGALVKGASEISATEAEVMQGTESRTPTTTREEDLHSSSQRQVNLIWERTQQVISIAIVTTTCLNVLIHLFLPEVAGLPNEWWTILGLVLGFYFGRTNHQNVGGIQLGR